MKKNKKGFTLIEIIVCIVLIVLIGGVVVFSLYKNNNEDKEKVKIANEIISAADVYYSINEEMQERLKSNYGYLVIGIDELKKYGLLSNEIKIPEATVEEQASGVDYNKIVLIDNDINNNFKNLSNSYDANLDDKIGFFEYIYPYKKNNPYFINLDSIYIEKFEESSFECGWGLENNEIKYVDENYDVITTTEYNCEFKSDGVNAKFYSYKMIDKNISSLRKVYINPDPDMNLVAKLNGTSNDYTCGTWTNSDIKLEILEDSSGVVHNDAKYTFFEDGYNIQNSANNYYILNIENDTKYEKTFSGKFEIKGKYVNNTSDGVVNNDCEIKIDKIEPKALEEIKNSKVYINISDDDSGLFGYYVSDTKLIDRNNIVWNSTGDVKTLKVEIDNKNQYVYVKDNAGNILEHEYVDPTTKLPSIKVEPVADSFTKLKVTVSDENGIKQSGGKYDIGVQFEFADDVNTEKDSGYYDYNSSYSILNKNNIIDYSKTAQCESDGTECVFYLDMKESVESCLYGSHCFISYNNLQDIKLNYYIKVTNELGYYRELKSETKLHYIINGMPGRITWGRDDSNSTTDVAFYGINSVGDILLTNSSVVGNNLTQHWIQTVYLYNNSQNTITSLPQYDNRTVKGNYVILEFTPKTIKYNTDFMANCSGGSYIINPTNGKLTCKNSDCYTHTYDILTNTFIARSDSCYSHEENVEYQYNNSYEQLKSYEFLGEYLSLIQYQIGNAKLKYRYTIGKYNYLFENNKAIKEKSIIVEYKPRSTSLYYSYVKLFFSTEPLLNSSEYISYGRI